MRAHEQDADDVEGERGDEEGEEPPRPDAVAVGMTAVTRDERR
jgi:hypothetical protein